MKSTNKRKFEDAYCTMMDRLITLEEVAEIYHRDRITFSNYCKGFLFCPECHSIDLIYVNDHPPYFRANDANGHSDDCSYGKDIVPKSRNSKYVNDTSNFDKIEYQLDSVITMLATDKEISKVINQSNSSVQGAENSRTKHNTRVSILQYLPRKRFDQGFFDDDFGVFKLYYGVALTEWEAGRKEIKVLFRHPIKKYLMCKLTMPYEVYRSVYFSNKFNTRQICLAAFIANFEEPYSLKYQVAELKNGKFLRLEQIRNADIKRIIKYP